jgi:hypothetical protein
LGPEEAVSLCLNADLWDLAITIAESFKLGYGLFENVVKRHQRELPVLTEY